MSLQVYYEDSFQAENNRSVSELRDEVLHASQGLFRYVVDSRGRFLPSAEWKDLKVIEMGAGRGGIGLHLARLGAQVTLLDYSPSALSQAERIYALEGLRPELVCGDVSLPDLKLPAKYDVMIDSHLLHCVTGDPERSSYFGLIKEHLSSRGLFIAETMVHRKNLTIPDGFMLDEAHTLWQMFGEWKPVRRIRDSLDLEQEIINSGLYITYFYYYAQLGFIPHRSFMDLPTEILPAAVRMVLTKQQILPT